MSLVRMYNNRSAKSIELVELEDSVENATDVMSRQEAIDKFLIRNARDVLVERTLKWNVGETVRTFINSIPEAIKAKFTTYVTEGIQYACNTSPYRHFVISYLIMEYTCYISNRDIE